MTVQSLQNKKDGIDIEIIISGVGVTKPIPSVPLFFVIFHLCQNTR